MTDAGPVSFTVLGFSSSSSSSSSFFFFFFSDEAKEFLVLFCLVLFSEFCAAKEALIPFLRLTHEFMENANTQRPDFDPSRAVPRDSPSKVEQKVQVPAMADDDDDNKRKIVVKSDDSFVALDIAELVAATDQWDPTASPRVPKLVMKSLSRNGSQRSGGGGGGAAVSAIGGPSGRDKPPASAHVAVEGEAAAAAARGRSRRVAGGRRPSLWRDPRRVLFVFASLSCMGTLILLYFTLSMGGMTAAGDADSR
ncbi:hypothetical protein MUK42_03907 [Musa troglodytarum]|uniref:Uncharacterized protein n=1 Tax=Musa troglodytarum TaxID=320322 RepID=A0A9E7GC58_9LILI|nr:hypothetical protein MUK42_03907 [Musa troglodytarum]